MSADRPKDFGSQRKKIVLIAVVVIGLIVVWQAFTLLQGNSTPDFKPEMPTSAGDKTGTPVTAAAGTQGTTSITTTTTQTAPANPTLRQEAVQQNNEVLKIARQSEPKYVAALSELEMLKLEREIAETNQAITMAKLTTVTTEQNIADLLTKASADTGTTPTPNQAGPFSNSEAAPAPQPIPAPPIRTAPEIPYTLSSVSYQDGKWHAVLSYNGKQMPVMVGDVLSIDQSVIVGITRDSVILKRNNSRRTIYMDRSI